MALSTPHFLGLLSAMEDIFVQMCCMLTSKMYREVTPLEPYHVF